MIDQPEITSESLKQVEPFAKEHDIDARELIKVTGLESLLEANAASFQYRSNKFLQLYGDTPETRAFLEEAKKKLDEQIIEASIPVFRRRIQLMSESDQIVA
jgi:hypothetical protein